MKPTDLSAHAPGGVHDNIERSRRLLDRVDRRNTTGRVGDERILTYPKVLLEGRPQPAEIADDGFLHVCVDRS